MNDDIQNTLVIKPCKHHQEKNKEKKGLRILKIRNFHVNYEKIKCDFFKENKKKEKLKW